MAKEMGLNPLSLIKNIPNKSQLWKAPVEEWIRDMYEKAQISYCVGDVQCAVVKWRDWLSKNNVLNRHEYCINIRTQLYFCNITKGHSNEKL